MKGYSRDRGRGQSRRDMYTGTVPPAPRPFAEEGLVLKQRKGRRGAHRGEERREIRELLSVDPKLKPILIFQKKFFF